jgi:ribosome maturation factor RimP
LQTALQFPFGLARGALQTGRADGSRWVRVEGRDLCKRVRPFFCIRFSVDMDLTTLQSRMEQQLSLLGFDLVLLESDGADVLRVFVEHRDHSVPVSLDDCVSVNDGLASWLDVEFPDLRYQVGLEISSPGLERPLLKPDHFGRFAGRLCRVQLKLPLDGQKRFKGWIGPVTDSGVTIEEDGRLVQIPLSLIQRARLAPFDEETTPRPKVVALAEPAGAAMPTPQAAGAAMPTPQAAGAEKSPAKEEP